jgi:signal transduction histidine kinase
VRCVLSLNSLRERQVPDTEAWKVFPGSSTAAIALHALPGLRIGFGAGHPVAALATCNEQDYIKANPPRGQSEHDDRPLHGLQRVTWPRQQPARTCRRMRHALLAGLLLLIAAAGEAQTAVKQVLVLQSLSRGNLTLDHFTGQLRANLAARDRTSVNIVEVVVGATGFVGPPEQAVVDYLVSMYAGGPPPDLIMTVGGPAALFAREYRQRLFPARPLIFAAMDERYVREPPLSANETAIAVVNDHPALIDDILRVLPDTRQIFMVTGSGAVGRFMRPEMERGLARFRDRVTFIWSHELSLADILQRVGTLPPHSAIVFQTFGSDAQGGTHAAEQVVADIHAAANAPLFAAQSPYLGRGIVGGSLMDIDDLARRTAEVALRILNGESPASFRVAPQMRGQPIYDWRELQRWNIPVSRLPPGSVVRFRPPGLWEAHQSAVLITIAALFLQTLLIARLLYERRARRRAEIESRRNLSLAADANRRETISALTTSIGHELGQPLSAIAQNARALQMMVEAEQAPADATVDILTDIQTEAEQATQIIQRHRTMLRSHQLTKVTIDLAGVIDESLALLAHDIRERQIATTIDLSTTPCIVQGDAVLLQQVFVNLIRNAIDALAGTLPAKRQIRIRSAVRSADVEISVYDTGSGLPAEMIRTLFTPFATTKSSGLGIGLAVTRTIVEAHGGTISARENMNGGAVFTVTLPRVTAPLAGSA